MSEAADEYPIPEWARRLEEQRQADLVRFAGHQFDEDGYHDPDSCYDCLLSQGVKSDCRCGQCCRRLLIEVLPQDAEREPKIKEFGSPILDPPDENGHRELIGWLLNNSREDVGCVFLDRKTNLC